MAGPPSLPDKLSSRPQILQPLCLRCLTEGNECEIQQMMNKRLNNERSTGSRVQLNGTTFISNKRQCQLTRGATFVLTLSPTWADGRFFFPPGVNTLNRLCLLMSGNKQAELLCSDTPSSSFCLQTCSMLACCQTSKRHVRMTRA